MKDNFLQEVYRYDKEDNSYHVVIDLDTYRDAYSEWDYSPLSNRDIDEDLLTFIMDCSEEIGLKRNMVIDFFIPKEIVNTEREQKSTNGFHRYFLFQIRRIKAERARKLKNMLVLFIIGTVFLSLANVLKFFTLNEMTSSLISEGLFIGAWVAIWEIFHTLFFSIYELNHKIKHHKRLQQVPINYKVK